MIVFWTFMLWMSLFVVTANLSLSNWAFALDSSLLLTVCIINLRACAK